MGQVNGRLGLEDARIHARALFASISDRSGTKGYVKPSDYEQVTELTFTISQRGRWQG